MRYLSYLSCLALIGVCIGGGQTVHSSPLQAQFIRVAQFELPPIAKGSARLFFGVPGLQPVVGQELGFKSFASRLVANYGYVNTFSFNIVQSKAGGLTPLLKVKNNRSGFPHGNSFIDVDIEDISLVAYAMQGNSNDEVMGHAGVLELDLVAGASYQIALGVGLSEGHSTPPTSIVAYQLDERELSSCQLIRSAQRHRIKRSTLSNIGFTSPYKRFSCELVFQAHPYQRENRSFDLLGEWVSANESLLLQRIADRRAYDRRTSKSVSMMSLKN